MDAHKRTLTTAFLIEGLLLLFFSCTAYWDLPAADRHIVLWAAVLGCLFLLCGLFFVSGGKVYRALSIRLQKAGAWLGISPLQVFALLTSPIFAALAIDAAGFWIKLRSPYVSIGAWFIAIGLALWGSWKSREESPRLSKGTILWLSIIVLAAFLFRGLWIGRMPILLTGDEASAGVNALKYASGEWTNLFITGWFSFPALFPFLQSISVRLFGNTVEALRIPSALAGALTAGALYLGGKAMFGQRAGVFAALILTALHFHVHFSRLGLNNIWDGLWFTATIAALWLGWKTQARWAYLLAGVSLGLAQYFYASSKALVAVVLVAAFLAFLFRRSRFRQALPDVCAMLIVVLVIFFPLGRYYLHEPKAFLAPLVRVSILDEVTASGAAFWNFLFRLLPSSLGAYTHIQFTPLSIWYTPDTALLRPIAATFFYIGLIFLFLHDRDSRLTLLILWLLVFGFVNALSSYIPAAQRYVASAPACALIAGYGLHKMSTTLGTLWPEHQKYILAAAYVVLLSLMVSDLAFYFVKYKAFTQLDEVTSNGRLAHQFGHYLKTYPAGTQVVFFGVPRLCYDSPAILYLAPHIEGMNAPEDWESFDRSQLTSTRVVFVFLPEYHEKINLVREDFPGGTLLFEEAWNDSILYWVYERNR